MNRRLIMEIIRIRYTDQRKIKKLIENEFTMEEFILYSYSEEDYKNSLKMCFNPKACLVQPEKEIREHNIPIKIIIPNE